MTGSDMLAFTSMLAISGRLVASFLFSRLDFYSLGLRDLARKLGVNATRLLRLIQKDRMQEDSDFFKAIRIGKTHKRYSGKCYEVLRASLNSLRST